MTTTWKHGGNIYEVAEILGCTPEEIVDVSASINPLGPPPGLRDYIHDLFPSVVHYPDIRHRDLIGALAQHHGLDEAHFAVGNGSTELLFWLPYAFRWTRVAVVVPTFSEYCLAAHRKGATVRRLITSWEHGFQPTIYQLEAMIESSHPDALFLTNPGSPSGVPLDPSVITFIEDAAARSPFFWVVDEVFADFCEEISLAHLVRRSSNVVIIRSLTKFYAIPGLRLGYLIANPSVVRQLTHFLPPWSVNTFAHRAGVYCLHQETFRRESLDFFHRERQRVFHLLDDIPHISYLKSVANYVLLHLGPSCPMNAPEVQRRLLEDHRILVRDCSNFEGMSDRFIRAAIASPEVNTLWTTALRDVLTSSHP